MEQGLPTPALQATATVTQLPNDSASRSCSASPAVPLRRGESESVTAALTDGASEAPPGPVNARVFRLPGSASEPLGGPQGALLGGTPTRAGPTSCPCVCITVASTESDRRRDAVRLCRGRREGLRVERGNGACSVALGCPALLTGSGRMPAVLRDPAALLSAASSCSSGSCFYC
ncbi:hypothetical protein SKAU_G00323880 [Synaphobranchus kaupii]|uniref:Uncharacterized protein n=1 Tax=Synaphobranchus kaupii TaxID=118154 RepID=A0A9Q1EPD0_SYNKA|nr:hypothetical protein SKAU_G00323880 [Synaphobranchus kaupii]